MFSSHRIKEEPSNDIQFPLLDENSEVNEAEQLLNIESECLLNSLKKSFDFLLHWQRDIVFNWNPNFLDCKIQPHVNQAFQ